MLKTLLLAAIAAIANVDAAPDSHFDLRFSQDQRIVGNDGASNDSAKPLYFSLVSPSGQSFPFTADIGTNFKAWLDPKISNAKAAANHRSLGLSITSKLIENKKDKIVLSLFRATDESSIIISDSERTHFLSFNFMLDRNYEVPSAWTIHFQAWQCCGGTPPLTMQVVPGSNPSGPVELAVAVRDDADARLPGHPQRTLYRFIVSRGVWTNVVFALRPSPDGSPVPGLVGLWINSEHKLSANVHWGYDPAQHSFEGHEVGSRIGLDFGIYRRRQLGTQTIYFDRIRYGQSFSSVIG